MSEKLLFEATGGGTPFNDLGLFTSVDLEVNKAYSGIINGSVSITLPEVVDIEIKNKITLKLKVLGPSIIDYGVNTNINIKSLAAGDYSLFFSYNNNTSNWVCENLKHAAVESNLKLLVRFNGNTVDESQNPLILTPSRLGSVFPVYEEGQYGQQWLTSTRDDFDNYILPSGNMDKLNLGSGDFTIRCWVRLSSTYEHPLFLFYKDSSTNISLGYNRFRTFGIGESNLNTGIPGLSMGSTAYFTLTRKNETIYLFINGVLITRYENRTEDWNLSIMIAIARQSNVIGNGCYAIQELIVKDSCDYISNFTPPEAPFELTDKYIADLHDDSKADKTELATMQAQAVETAAVYTDQKSAEGKTYTDSKVDTLQLVQYVDALPASGDTKYIYAVPQDERTIDGQIIVVLFIWTGTEWAAVGALSTAIDLTEYLKKTEASAAYLSKSGGTLTGDVTIAANAYQVGLKFDNSAYTGKSSFYICTLENQLYIYRSDLGLSKAIIVNALGQLENRGGGGLYLMASNKAVPNGLATLDANGKVPVVQIPQTILDRLSALEADVTALKNSKTEGVL